LKDASLPGLALVDCNCLSGAGWDTKRIESSGEIISSILDSSAHHLEDFARLYKILTSRPAIQTPTANSSGNSYTICLPELGDNIGSCNSAVELMNDPSTGVSFSCIDGGSVTGCLAMLKDGIAAVAKVPASGIYMGDKMGTKPVVSEFFSDTLGKYTEGYAVAIVDATWCYGENKNSLSYSTLESTNACFSGYASDGGWNVPIGTLFNDGDMPVVSNSNTSAIDAQSAIKYFKDVSCFLPSKDKYSV